MLKGRPKRWKFVTQEHGVWTVQLPSWRTFHDFVTQFMLDYSHFVWRGERCDNQPLLPSFDREYAGLTQAKIEAKLASHLKMFKLATRGRRGSNPPMLRDDNEWWAIGQHVGLSTPLLDWTRSPFVALFFAFETEKSPQTPCRVVYAISANTCDHKSAEIRKAHKGQGRPDVAEFFSPLQDDNFRLVSQNGLLSRCTAGKSLETWVTENCQKDNHGILIKIFIPDKERQECLRSLNRMNINHLTLFPDLYGASRFCNMITAIPKY